MRSDPHKEIMSTIHTVSAPFGAHPIVIETGKLAKLDDGAVTVRYNDTLVIVTAVSATKIKEGQNSPPAGATNAPPLGPTPVAK